MGPTVRLLLGCVHSTFKGKYLGGTLKTTNYVKGAKGTDSRNLLSHHLVLSREVSLCIYKFVCHIFRIRRLDNQNIKLRDKIEISVITILNNIAWSE